MSFTSRPIEEGRNRARRQRTANGGDAPAGRTMPEALETEVHLLSNAILDGESVIAQAWEAGVRVHTFFEPKHGLVWGVMVEMWQGGKPLKECLPVLAQEMKERGLLDQVGGYRFLAEVSGKVATTAQTAYFIEKVVEYARMREVIRAGTEAVESVYSYGGGGLGSHLAGPLDRLQELRAGMQRDLPRPVNLAAFCAAEIPRPRQLVRNLVHQGEVVLGAAPSKGHKSWVALDFSHAVASGLAWLGFPTEAVPVLHVDLELAAWALKERVSEIAKAREVAVSANVELWSLRGYARAIDDLFPVLAGHAPAGKYGLIVLEPSYLLLGGRDENDNGDVTDYMKQLAKLARVTGAAVFTTHHFAKGDQSKKDAKDRASGAGAWLRAPDLAVTLTQLNDEQGPDAFAVEFTTRHVRRPAAVGVRWEFPLMRLQSGLDLNAVREPGRPKESTEKDVVRLLGDETLTHGEWKKRAVKAGISERTFDRRREDAMEAGLVTQVGSCYQRTAVRGGGSGAASAPPKKFGSTDVKEKAGANWRIVDGKFTKEETS